MKALKCKTLGAHTTHDVIMREDIDHASRCSWSLCTCSLGKQGCIRCSALPSLHNVLNGQTASWHLLVFYRRSYTSTCAVFPNSPGTQALAGLPRLRSPLLSERARAECYCVWANSAIGEGLGFSAYMPTATILA